MFIAIDVGGPVREDARRIRERLRIERRDAESALRWVDPQQMHLTLRFIGETDDASAARLVGAFRDQFAVRRFAYEVAAPSWFPNPSRPRVLVREVTQGRDEIASIVDEVEGRMREASVVADADRKPFRPHITLARVREGRERALRAVPADWWAAAAPSGSVATSVDRVSIVNSELTPRGPVYRVLAESALTGVS